MMKETMLDEIFSNIFENEFYVNSNYRRKANKVIDENLTDIQKYISHEEYGKIEEKIMNTQNISEECGFIFGFRYAVCLMCECKNFI